MANLKALTKALSVIASGALMTCLLGCSADKADIEELANVHSAKEFHDPAIDMEAMSFEIAPDDAQDSYDASSAAQITLSDAEISSSGTGININGQTVSIASPGTYIISGELSNGQISVDVPESGDVQLVLAGCQINNATGPAIFVNQAANVRITLAEGSTNVITDSAQAGEGQAESQSTTNSASDAAGGTICSRAPLAINGPGRLGVIGNRGNGIFSEQGISISDGDISVNANDDAIHGCANVKIGGGTLTLNSGRDGIISSSAGAKDEGIVSVTKGTLTINAQEHGIHASTYANIYDGFYAIASEDCSIVSDIEGRICTGQFDLNAGTCAVLFKNVFHMEGGEIRVEGSQFGFCSEKLFIDQGDSTINAENDALLSLPSEELEAYCDHDIPASSVNVEGTSADDDCMIQMTMGAVKAYCAGNVLRSAGSILINGGVLQGGTTSTDSLCMDYAHDAYLNGGTVVLTSMSNTIKDFNGGTAATNIALIAGDVDSIIELDESDGNNITRYTSPIAFNSVLVGSSTMKQGNKYVVEVNGETVSLTSNV